MLTLYDYTPAPSPLRARIFLAEKNIDYKNIQVDLRSGEQFNPDFMKINPRCAVPVLVTEDNQIVTENISIASYLEDIFPNPPLMGSTPIEKAHILEWNWRIEFEGLAAIADILRNTSKAMNNRALTGPRNISQIAELAERGRKRLGYFFEDLNQHLSQSDYIVGEQFSFADITAFVTMNFSAWVKESPGLSLKALHRWHKKVSARPSTSA